MNFNDFWPQDGAQNDPRQTPRRIQEDLEGIFFHIEFCVRFWIVLGFILITFGEPFGRVDVRACVCKCACMRVDVCACMCKCACMRSKPIWPPQEVPRPLQEAPDERLPPAVGWRKKEEKRREEKRREEDIVVLCCVVLSKVLGRSGRQKGSKMSAKRKPTSIQSGI